MSHIAPTRNVLQFSTLAERVCNRNPDLPGIGIFYGFSGFGKTRSAEYSAHKQRAFYVEVGESWTKKFFLQRLATEIGVSDKGSIPIIVERIIETLAMDPRLVIIDEFDHVVSRNYHETVREIHDKAQTPIICIGEELLPGKIESLSERFHNRVLDWVPAQPSDRDDFCHLLDHYCPGITLEDALVEQLIAASGGRARRICINLDRIRELSLSLGSDVITTKECPRQMLFTGRAPSRRAS
jgi:hypothetical protein